MYYFAFVDENDIVQAIYTLPTVISDPQYIQIASNDQSLIGKHYNRETCEFEDVYYYAILNEKSICVNVAFAYEEITDSSYIAITATQYSDGTVVGMYWNGTAFVTAPISLLAVASTDTVNYKNQDKWLSTKLDEMDEAIEDNSTDISTLSTDLSEVVTSLATVTNSLATLTTAVEGKANTSHTHGAADLSGVVKTINGTAPDSDGNVVISTGSGMTASEILEAVKTVDGANSGLDADTLDGMEATAFATANHTHSDYLTEDDISGLATTAAVNTALSGKADVDHTHTGYAAADHVHTNYASVDHVHSNYATADHTHSGYATTASVTALETAVSGKADSTHNHDTAYAAINHTHTGYAAENHTHSEYATTTSVTALENSLNGKADANHTHSGYATTESVTALETALDNKASASHTHTQEDITGLSTALSGKADTNHTHSGYAATNHTHSEYASSSHTHSNYLSTSGGTVSGTLNVNAAIKSNSVQVGYNSGSDTTLGSNSYPTIVAGTYVTLNGEKVYSPNIYPRNTGTFYLGAQSNRWSGIYSKEAVNVSSDERLKENIAAVDTEECVDFINALDVKTFNYIGNETEQIGVIAQQLVSVNPDFAKYFVEQGDDGYYGVKTSDLVFPLIETVQALIAAVQEHEERFEALEK